MKSNNELSNTSLRSADDKINFERMLARLRQDQLDAAHAGRIAESAFYAAEAQALRGEFAQEDVFLARN